MKNKISFGKVVDVNQWQRIQDHFAEIIGVTLRTVDSEGNLLTKPSRETRFCKEIVRGSHEGMTRCGMCLPPSMADLESNKTWKEGYQCHIGLNNFFVPIVLPNDKRVAYVLVGPLLLGGRPNPDELQKMAAGFGIDIDKLKDGLIEIKVFSFSGIESVIELLQEVASYILEMGYQKFKLERMILVPRLNKTLHKFYINKLLNALLDISFNVTGGEIGSIMLLDEKAGELYIRIGRGIKKDIIKQTRLKIGEGIAGLAAQERRFLLVDDKITDERLKGRLTRPEIKSAIVAPIHTGDKLFGIMNIATLHSSDKFSSENINVLHQLVELTSVTLQDLLKV